MSIAAYTSICEEDKIWIPQYLKEAERLDLPFAINFDRCSEYTKRLLKSHHLYIGGSVQDNPNKEFSETDKQDVFNVVVAQGFDMSIAWDIDETWDKDARAKLADMELMDCEYVKCKWVNLWNDPQHIRVDGPFISGHRDKAYKLNTGYTWRFCDPRVNGPKRVLHPKGKPERLGHSDLVCIHWGMMTRRLREEHKVRWDRIYGAHGGNLYGFWNYALDEETYPPVIEEHSYL